MYDIKKAYEDLRSGRRKKVILDTDTYNEIDDQYALSYLLQSFDAVELIGVTAVPFHNWKSESYADGMERSYQEILNVVSLTKPDFDVPVFRGSTERLKDTKTPVSSPAADFIIEQAMACQNEPLYILGIGALTNIASALLKEPAIQDKIVVVWLGCNEIELDGNAGEFNLDQDYNCLLYTSSRKV